MTLNIVKLCVGCESIDDLIAWQMANAPRWAAGTAEHVTRMWPKREAELLEGGSLYWVIKGEILCRQSLVGLQERRGADGIARCALVLDRGIVRTIPAPRRAFQGWRYLPQAESPADLPPSRGREEELPADLARALAEIGLR